jgi:hydrogenase maturation protein HypF
VSEPLARARIEFEGIVQGVGFRPFLHRVADELGLAGWVLNSSAGVLMELEGTRVRLDEYITRVKAEAPPLSRILTTRVRFLSILGYHGFTIKPSLHQADALTLLCPDVATCQDCLRELFDPLDRRFRYPFINCTNCGPRYTIVRGLPYDRPQTTMAGFPLCADCRREYENVNDRRYHAQPVACPVCGPRLWFETPDGMPQNVDPLAHSIALLQKGLVLAVKGLGGFHLACRADSDEAVLALRQRKKRSFFKPLAVMFPDLDAVQQLCEVDAAAVAWLTSPAAPIVLLQLKHGVAGAGISRYIAPNLRRLGVMLPYTPLHHLLLADLGKPLVMTSGNVSDEPLVSNNQTAREKLASFVDGLLLHDRPIHARCDDSVLAADSAGGCTMLRHSRGFTPFPIALPDAGPDVLAFGGDIKTTFAVNRGRFAFLSPHLGDADQIATYAFFRETWAHYQRLFGLQPDAIACDMHPGYYTARWAEELADELSLPLLRVQHHHAHLVALLIEHGLSGPHPAIVADGVGYGADGAIWGGELLYGEAKVCKRVAHLKPIMLPGGDAATREPWRIALALLHAAAPELLHSYAESLFSGELARSALIQMPWRISHGADPSYKPPTKYEVDLVLRMLETNVNVVLSTALGRLFDGFAALLGITLNTTYEGQAPMELEALADTYSGGLAAEATNSYFHTHDALTVLDWTSLVQYCASSQQSPQEKAYGFHRWVCDSFSAALELDQQTSGSQAVLATGGCMQNSLLKYLLSAACAKTNRRLVTHREIPAGDGGLALGVLRVAQAQHTGSDF